MIHCLLIILTRDQAGFYREGMITGYNSPFPSSKNSRFKNEAKGTVKRATNRLQNESESDAARFIAHKSNLSCSK